MGWPPSPPWPAAKAQATDTLEAGSTSNALLSKVHPPYKAPLLWRRHLSWQTAGVAPFFVWSTRVVILKRWCSKLRGATKKTPHPFWFWSYPQPLNSFFKIILVREKKKHIPKTSPNWSRVIHGNPPPPSCQGTTGTSAAGKSLKTCLKRGGRWWVNSHESLGLRICYQ